MKPSTQSGFQNRKALWADDSSVYLYCHNAGNGTLPGDSGSIAEEAKWKISSKKAKAALTLLL